MPTPLAAPTPSHRPKSWRLYAVIVIPWLASIVAFDPYLVSLFARHGGPAWHFGGWLFALLTDTFWFYGFYHLGNSLVGLWLIRRARPAEPARSNARVAILYTTMNDLQERAVLACLAQDHPACTVYLLDDSTAPESLDRVDRFAAEHPEVVVVRRQDRRGYKAGNMNNGLRMAAAGCDYFAVIDADDVVPPNFVSGLLSRFAAPDSEDVAFVQARYTQDPRQDHGFAHDMGAGIDVHWKYYVPCRDHYGFLLFYGHGALIRRDVWERVGGFPEVVSEDLAFAARVRALGMRGAYEPSVVATEEFPPTYAQFLRRQGKWLRGTMHWILSELPRLARDPALPWLERVDVAVTSASVLLPVPFLLFSLMTMGLALAAGEWRYLTVERGELGSPLLLGPFALPPLPPPPPGGLLAITVLTIFAPVSGFILEHHRQPTRLLAAVARGSTVHLSAIVSLFSGALDYLLTRRTEFRATGDLSIAAPRPPIVDLSTVAGACICLGSIVTFNPFPMALGIALVLRRPMERMPASAAIRGLTWVPFLLVAMGTLLSATPAGAVGSLLFLVGAHF